MSAVTAIGWFASALAISMFFPQLIRTYRFGFDGSIVTIILATLNGAAWVAYGLLRGDMTIVVCNSLLGSSAFLIFLRWAVDGRRNRSDRSPVTNVG
ncbi:MAG TPA: hypothetical protein VN108_09315 [Marmoricola sp.]|nr:hypothetical protein [Marmoricola sp.]